MLRECRVMQASVLRRNTCTEACTTEHAGTMFDNVAEQRIKAFSKYTSPFDSLCSMIKKQFFRYITLASILLSAHSLTFAQQSIATDVQKRLSDLLSSSKEEELLEPDQAFKLKLTATGPNTVTADLVPANGYYLYRDRIRFGVKNSPGVSIKNVKLPPGKVKNDPTFGRTETYEKPIQAEITLARSSNTKRVTLTAGYQGCNEKTGVCYPPIDKEVALSLP